MSTWVCPRCGGVVPLGVTHGCGITTATGTSPPVRLALDEAVVRAALEVVDAHRRLIFAVTPGHPRATFDDRERYEAIFSRWHDRTRNLRDALNAAGVDTGEAYT